MRLFPDAKFVFLWRNPLAVVASMMETFRDGRFEPYEFPAELVRGPMALAAAFEANRERAHSVRYEDLMGEGREEHWRGIFDYLELEWDPQVLEGFSGVQLRGQFGDPTGMQRYSSLSTEPLNKWRRSFHGEVRQAWAQRWLGRLGAAPLETMGYDPARLIQDLRDAGPARVDRWRSTACSWRAPPGVAWSANRRCGSKTSPGCSGPISSRGRGRRSNFCGTPAVCFSTDVGD